MAYQLPPPPHHDDPIVRAWLFEVWKRNQDILDNSASIGISGEVLAPQTLSVNGAFTIPATINLPYLTNIDGGSAGSNFTGAPVVGLYDGVLSKGADVKTSTTTVVANTDFGGEIIYDIATDGVGNWVLLTANGHVWYSSNPSVSWTEGTLPAFTNAGPIHVEYDGTSTWMTIASGCQTAFISTDNGANWTKQRDTGTNLSGVDNFYYSTVLSRWIAGGAPNITWYTTDEGATWTSAINGATNTPRVQFEDDDSWCIFGFNTGPASRNGSTVSNTFASWTMTNNLPASGVYTGVPAEVGGYDGTNYVLGVGALGYEHEYWVGASEAGAWTTGLRYHATKTDDIKFLRYIAAEELWYCITEIGEVFTTPDITLGDSGFTQITTGALPGEIPRNNFFMDEGSDAWCFTANNSDVVVNVFD